MKRIYEISRNCEHVARARRAAFLVDGATYFPALRETIRRARTSIFIVGWDMHSEIKLVREGEDDGLPTKLGPLLNEMVAERPDLHIYLLCWDFAMIYALEREFFPRYRFKWGTHKRIHFCLDGAHPIGASQHQKLVVVDDCVAFAGGIDISQWRWDTSEHRPDDERRRDPRGKTYPPFHDVQMIVDGAVAEALGNLVRQRWKRAGGSPPAVEKWVGTDDPWPETVDPDLRDVDLAIARTLPAYEDRSEVREVERLYLDSIAAARRCIYIENQYLSAHCISEALAQRLQEPDGPEMVIVLPEKTGGWLEQHTMDVLRGRVLKRLRAADRYNRLRIYYPRLAIDPHCSLMVHAKVMVIDDRFVRVGSSNLSNRSMGLDSECDLAVDAFDNPEIRTAIVEFRNRLIAEHLGISAQTLYNALETSKSLIGAIDSLREGERSLQPLSGDVPPEVDQWVPESELLDPEKPVEPDVLFNYFVSPDQQSSAFRQWLKTILLIGGLLTLAALWRWTPVGEWVDVGSALAAAEWIRQQPLAPIWVLATFIAGGLIAFPVTLMIIAAVIVFGPWWGAGYSLFGAALSALATFAAGRLAGRDSVRRLSGSLANRVSRTLTHSGLLTIITLRIIPVAPFSIINAIAGASGIRLRDFALGTIIGMIPGVVAIALLADRIAESLRRPEMGTIAALAAVVAAVGLGLLGLRKWIRRKRSAHEK